MEATRAATDQSSSAVLSSVADTTPVVVDVAPLPLTGTDNAAVGAPKIATLPSEDESQRVEHLSWLSYNTRPIIFGRNVFAFAAPTHSRSLPPRDDAFNMPVDQAPPLAPIEMAVPGPEPFDQIHQHMQVRLLNMAPPDTEVTQTLPKLSFCTPVTYIDSQTMVLNGGSDKTAILRSAHAKYFDDAMEEQMNIQYILAATAPQHRDMMMTDAQHSAPNVGM